LSFVDTIKLNNTHRNTNLTTEIMKLFKPVLALLVLLISFGNEVKAQDPKTKTVSEENFEPKEFLLLENGEIMFIYDGKMNPVTRISFWVEGTARYDFAVQMRGNKTTGERAIMPIDPEDKLSRYLPTDQLYLDQKPVTKIMLFSEATVLL